MKLEVGMYVRTLTLSGFSRIGKLEKIDDICVTDNGAIDKTQILKASHNIIDLIEVGDYVNGELVEYIEVDSYKDYVINSGYWCKQEDIKSIVTKEMYSSVEYRVEAD